MMKYNADEILQKINELPNEETVELLSNFTLLDLMKIINHPDTYTEYMKEMAESTLKLSRISTGLYQVFAAINGMENNAIVQETLSDMRKLTTDLEINLEAYEFAAKMQAETEGNTH